MEQTNKVAIETAAAGSQTPAAPETPAAPAAPEQSAPAQQTPHIMESGGEVSDQKIQWAAVGIFALTIIALAYKAIYYRKATTLIGGSDEKIDKKLKELESNIRAVRKDKYESVA
jgi:hypothetical protein